MPSSSSRTSAPPPFGSPPPHQRRPVSRWSRFCRGVRVFLGHLFSNLGLFTLVVGYVLLGALLFESLEAEYELEQRGNIKQYRDDCLNELWKITERLNVLYQTNWTHMAHEELRRFETNVVAAAKLEGYDGKDVLDSERQWSFSGALLYSVTVITTIGYGNLAPKTPAGKVLTMLYAVFGVPLMLLCLSNLGQLLAHTFQFAYSHMCCSKRRGGNQRGRSTSTCSHKQRTSRHHHHPLPPEEPLFESGKHSGVNNSPAHVGSLDLMIPPPEQFKRKAPPPPPRLTPPKPRQHLLSAEARMLLVECAEYTVSQQHPGGRAGEQVQDAQRLLQDLKQPQREEVSVEQQHDSGAEDEFEEEEGPSTPSYSCKSQFDTPSRVPLLSRSPASSLTSRPRSPLRHQAPASECPPSPLITAPSPTPESASSNSSSRGGRVPVSVVLVVLSGYICLGAAVFAAWEDWSLLDGAYFCFITLSTIGFGDLVPGKSFQRAADPGGGGEVQLVVCCAYLLMGLVLIATAFSLVQEEVGAKCRAAARKIGILPRAED